HLGGFADEDAAIRLRAQRAATIFAPGQQDHPLGLRYRQPPPHRTSDVVISTPARMRLPSLLSHPSHAGLGRDEWQLAQALIQVGPPPPGTVSSTRPGAPWIEITGARPGSLWGFIKVSATGASNTPLTAPATLYIRYY